MWLHARAPTSQAVAVKKVARGQQWPATPKRLHALAPSHCMALIAAGRPLVYMNQNALASWHTNSGTGGGYTENGALTAGPTVRGTGANDFLPVGTITATNDSPTNGDA